MTSKHYEITLMGESPLLFHRDNLTFSEEVKAWRKNPENKALCEAGDDRSPAWTWIGCLYHDGNVVGIDSDCLMSMLREGGAKLKTGKKSETFKKHTQSGVLVREIQFPLLVGGKSIKWAEISKLIGETNFEKHQEFAKAHNFDLFVKRATVGQSKHVRVRPLFEHWTASGTVTVLDEDQSGITGPILQQIFDICGSLVGLCDWRPGGRVPGQFGRFKAQVNELPE